MRKRIVGYTFIAIGVAGICLPVLPGIPFLLIGMRLLGPDHWITRPIMGAIHKMKAKRHG